MSIISVVEAIPSRVKLLYEYLEGKSGEDKSRLISFAAPKAFASSSSEALSTVRDPLSEAIKMGLLIETDGRVSARPLDMSVKRNYGFSRAYDELVEWLLFSPESPGRDQQAFAPALSWLLTQSPREPLQFSDSQRIRLEHQIGASDSYQLTNASAWQDLCYWSRALGYSTIIGLKGKRIVIPDPTLALRRHLDSILPPKEPMRVAEVFAALSARCPVLEGGNAREEVEARFSAPPREYGRLSESTSLGLLRLESQQRVRLDALADADTLTLDLGGKYRQVSHVARTRVVLK